MEAEAEAEAIRVSHRSSQRWSSSAVFILNHLKWNFQWVKTACLLQVKGEAEAFAVEAKGRAEAEQMTKKAEAFQQYKDGAMVDMLLEKLPLVRESRL